MDEVGLLRDRLLFSFPEVDVEANVWITFQRTLRIPDDGKEYPLPPGLGGFPLARVDDHGATVPESWRQHGGVMLPMYQSEAMWLLFDCDSRQEREMDLDSWRRRFGDFEYPMAIRIACGKVCAVSGGEWRDGLDQKKQNYVVAPQQPWLDGFSVKRGQIRQFVAMPLGAGYSAEEQVTGEAEWGGIQIEIFPMKRDRAERLRQEHDLRRRCVAACHAFSKASMGLAPGGRMRQEIYEDPYGIDAWDTAHSARCFVHICNSLVWRQITGGNPPHPPVTAEEYTRNGLPWFDWYGGDAKVLDGSKTLADLKSVTEMGKEKKDAPLPANASVEPGPVVKLGPRSLLRSWFGRRDKSR